MIFVYSIIFENPSIHVRFLKKRKADKKKKYTAVNVDKESKKYGTSIK